MLSVYASRRRIASRRRKRPSPHCRRTVKRTKPVKIRDKKRHFYHNGYIFIVWWFFFLMTLEDKLTPPSTPPSVDSTAAKSRITPQVSEASGSYENGDIDLMDIAKKMYHDQFVSIQPEEYTQFLAAADAESEKIRDYYMDLFTWHSNLLTSTRMLCAKLHLKGESQEIDRILSSFTKSYIRQHPCNVFATQNFEKIYIVLYLIILLNTALHNHELANKSKISQTEYVRNTFLTFVQQDARNSKSLSIKQRIVIERELCEFYDDLVRHELHLKDLDPSQNLSTSQFQPLSRQLSGLSIWLTDTGRRSSYAAKRISTTPLLVSHYPSSTSLPSKSRVGFTRALASDLKVYSHLNGSRVSATSVRNRNSLDHLRTNNLNNLSNTTPLSMKRSSRASIMSRESTATLHDDTLVLLMESHLNQLDLDSDAPVQNVDEFNVDDYQDSYDLTLELQGSPYLKEGLLRLKIINNDQVDSTSSDVESSAASTMSTSGASRFFSFFRSSPAAPPPAQTGTHSLISKFVEDFVVVSKGELSLYSFDPKVIKKQQQKVKKFQKRSLMAGLENTPENDEVGDGNWLKNAACVGQYNLCDTHAQLEKSLSTGKVIWSLTFPKISKKPAKKFIFEAGTKEVALEFINSCNFWAAKITAVPTLEESVSLIEYGWTNLDHLIAKKDQFKRSKDIHKWEPLPKGVYLSSYVVDSNDSASHTGMMKQFVKTLAYHNSLKRLYAEFNLQKIKFMKNINSTGTNYNRVVGNFEAKIADYKFEMKKYKSYLIILAFGLQLRFDLEDQDHEEDELFNDSDVNLEGETVARDLEVVELELTKLVKFEIRRLFMNMKGISRIIPTYQSLRSITEMAELAGKDGSRSFPLVKSPKTFTLANYNDTESPVNQLLNTTGNSTTNTNEKDFVHSYSTNTIKEEEEETEDDHKLSIEMVKTAVVGKPQLVELGV